MKTKKESSQFDLGFVIRGEGDPKLVGHQFLIREGVGQTSSYRVGTKLEKTTEIKVSKIR